MSTKIYDAYLWNSSFEELMPELEKIRKSRIKYWKNFYLSHDSPEKLLNVSLSDSYNDKNTKDICTEDVVIYVNRDDIYVQFFMRYTGRRTIKNKLFVDFHYQNQSDKPDHITDIEWKIRRKVWNKIFKKYSTPAQAGLTYQLCNWNMLYYNHLYKIIQDSLRKEKIT